jgi:hypothetical protein
MTLALEAKNSSNLRGKWGTDSSSEHNECLDPIPELQKEERKVDQYLNIFHEAVKQFDHDTFTQHVYQILCEAECADREHQLTFEKRFLNGFGSLDHIKVKDMRHPIMWGIDEKGCVFLVLKLKYVSSPYKDREFVSIVYQNCPGKDQWTWNFDIGQVFFMGPRDYDLLRSLLRGEEIKKGSTVKLVVEDPIPSKHATVISQLLSCAHNMPMFSNLINLLPHDFFTADQYMIWNEKISMPIIGNISHKDMKKSIMWGIDPLSRLFFAFKLIDCKDQTTMVVTLYQQGCGYDGWSWGGDRLFSEKFRVDHLEMLQNICERLEVKIKQSVDFSAINDTRVKNRNDWFTINTDKVSITSITCKLA